MCIKFSENDVRPMGRTAMGVKAISLKEEDYVVSANRMSEDTQVLNVTENGYGKRTLSSEFRVQTRGGMGVKIHDITEKTGLLTGVLMIEENEEIMLISSDGIIIRLRGREISTVGRVSQGVKLINLGEEVRVVGIAKISEEDIEIEEELENLDEEMDMDITTEEKVETTDNNLQES
jgi:DNA gyrase subunit A